MLGLLYDSSSKRVEVKLTPTFECFAPLLLGQKNTYFINRLERETNRANGVEQLTYPSPLKTTKRDLTR